MTRGASRPAGGPRSLHHAGAVLALLQQGSQLRRRPRLTFVCPWQALKRCTSCTIRLEVSLRYEIGGKVSRQVAWNWLLSFMVSSAKPGKSRAWMQEIISRRRAGTTDSALNCKAQAVLQGGAGTGTTAWLHQGP